MENECTDTGDSFMFSFCEYDDGSYCDMDLTLPWNGNNSPLEVNTESEEFEFSVWPNTKECDDNVSPADDLFYRGLLLPLNLSTRLEMVRNLSSPKCLEGDTDDFDGFSSGSRDSNQRPDCCKESWCRSDETEEKTHFQPKVKSATKSKVKIPMFGFSKFSKQGMDDFSYSPHFPPPMAKLIRFMVKSKPMKAGSVPFYTTDCISKQNPDYPLNSDRTHNSTSVKHIVQKSVRLMKHIISSQRHNDAQTGDQKLKMDEGRVWPCIEDESGRQIHVDFRHFGVESSMPSVNSSLSFCSEDLQSAIAYCKQSNGGIGKKKHMT